MTASASPLYDGPKRKQGGHMAKRLVKSTDKKLFGVAGGLAEYFNVDPTLVRVGFVVACIACFFLGLVAYVALAIMMPSARLELSSGQSLSDDSPDDEARILT